GCHPGNAQMTPSAVGQGPGRSVSNLSGDRGGRRMILGAARPVADAVARLVRPGGLDVLGPPENVWLCALGLAILGPALATVAPRLVRPLALLAAWGAVAPASVATDREQNVLAVA